MKTREREEGHSAGDRSEGRIKVEGMELKGRKKMKREKNQMNERKGERKEATKQREKKNEE